MAILIISQQTETLTNIFSAAVVHFIPDVFMVILQTSADVDFNTHSYHVFHCYKI